MNVHFYVASAVVRAVPSEFQESERCNGENGVFPLPKEI
jgi:hypothetical protein